MEPITCKKRGSPTSAGLTTLPRRRAALTSPRILVVIEICIHARAHSIGTDKPDIVLPILGIVGCGVSGRTNGLTALARTFPARGNHRHIGVLGIWRCHLIALPTVCRLLPNPGLDPPRLLWQPRSGRWLLPPRGGRLLLLLLRPRGSWLLLHVLFCCHEGVLSPRRVLPTQSG